MQIFVFGKKRLSAREVKHVVQRIAPISKGSITQEDIHHFICTATRSNGQLIKVDVQ